MESFVLDGWQVAASFAFYFPVFGGILFPMFWPFGITLLFYLSWWPWLKHFPDWWYFLTSNIHIEGLYGLTMVVAPVLIILGLAITAIGFAQILKTRLAVEAS